MNFKKYLIVLALMLSNGLLFANHWTPNASSFEDNTTLTGIIQIDGVEQHSAALEVGVFCGSDCRGTALPTFFPPTQRHVVQITIFGENGDQLSFKLFDHDTNQELSLTSPDAVTFNSNGYGTLTSPYVLNFTGNANSYVITAEANPSEGGTVSGDGTFVSGSTCTLTATPNNGYQFNGWTENGNTVSASSEYTFTVDADRNLVAQFSLQGYHWTPNASSFEDNTTLTGIIQIDGVEQHSAALEVGVFCGSDCRGTALPTFFPPTQRHVVQITIFGENGDQLSFKLFDHDTNQELSLTSPDPITFNSNGYGTLTNPYVLNFTSSQTAQTQTTECSQGWNWYSTYIEMDGETGLQMLEESLGSNALVIKSQGKFTTYENGVWSGTLETISNADSYMIQIANDCSIEINGMVANPGQQIITLHSGWTWMGYPVDTCQSLESAFAGMTPCEGDVIKSQNSFAIFVNGVWVGTMDTLEPGKGYMYLSNNPDTVTFSFPVDN